MPSICFYFQVHQPYRLRKMSFFESVEARDCFDHSLNEEVMKKVAVKCYLPTNRLILDLIHRHHGAFRVAFSISGVAIDQMKAYSPETLESFQKLAATGAVEFLGETYYHSLSAIHDGAEFETQVDRHRHLIFDTFGVWPKVFRNTELIYTNSIGLRISKMDFDAVIAEGADDILGWRSPNFVYDAKGTDLKLLLKNYRLSDDIAFRFSNRSWAQRPLTADKFANWIGDISGSGDTVNLFMDYETFSEHKWGEHGSFDFLEHLPTALFKLKDWNFANPTEVVWKYPSVGEVSFPRLVSWSDAERDVTAWLGNEMQAKAWTQIYGLSERVQKSDKPELSEIWRRLQTSDHFYYMCTKWFSDGDIHAYFNPYESPYEAFVFYQNALKKFEECLFR